LSDTVDSSIPRVSLDLCSHQPGPTDVRLLCPRQSASSGTKLVPPTVPNAQSARPPRRLRLPCGPPRSVDLRIHHCPPLPIRPHLPNPSPAGARPSPEAPGTQLRSVNLPPRRHCRLLIYYFFGNLLKFLLLIILCPGSRFRDLRAEAGAAGGQERH